MLPDNLHTTDGKARNLKADVESWGGQSVFQQFPSNDSAPVESKHTRRGTEEGLGNSGE